MIRSELFVQMMKHRFVLVTMIVVLRFYRCAHGDLTVEPKEFRYHTFYMDIAIRASEMSYAVRKKVGAVAVRDGTILATGWNGTPSGMDNNCEDTIFATNADWIQHDYSENSFRLEFPFMKRTPSTFEPSYYKLVTKQEVSHAEENCLSKITKSTQSSIGATVYVTLSPCIHCAKMLYSAGISTVVVKEHYRDDLGTKFLIDRGITVIFL